MLLRDDNPQTVHPNVWGLIGGGIEHGETPLEAMHRECREEIGVSPGLFTYIGEDAGGRHLFYASLSEQEAGRIRLGCEGQKLAFSDRMNSAGWPPPRNSRNGSISVSPSFGTSAMIQGHRRSTCANC
jgi:ADP-ribose pyrophosphatase YjhB (NUDIX family)